MTPALRLAFATGLLLGVVACSTARPPTVAPPSERLADLTFVTYPLPDGRVVECLQRSQDWNDSAEPDLLTCWPQAPR